MLWIVTVGYFSDSSRITCIYGVITLIILKESIDNQKVMCVKYKEVDSVFNIEELCKKRLLFNYKNEKEVEHNY